MAETKKLLTLDQGGIIAQTLKGYTDSALADKADINAVAEAVKDKVTLEEVDRHLAPVKRAFEMLEQRVDDTEQNIENDKAEIETALTAKADKTEVAKKQDKLTVSEDLSLSSASLLSLTDKAKKRLFIDMWTKCYDCQYDATKEEQEGEFTCNTVAMSYEDAIKVYNAPRIAWPHSFGGQSVVAPTLILSSEVTNGTRPDLSHVFRGLFKAVRVARDNSQCYCSGITYCFYNTSVLTTVLGILNVESCPNYNNAFLLAVKLTDIQLKGVKFDISFSDSPLISKASLEYLVANSANGATKITVTVHADTYAKLTDTANTEWHKVLTDASAKNISFAKL